MRHYLSVISDTEYIYRILKKTSCLKTKYFAPTTPGKIKQKQQKNNNSKKQKTKTKRTTARKYKFNRCEGRSGF